MPFFLAVSGITPGSGPRKLQDSDQPGPLTTPILAISHPPSPFASLTCYDVGLWGVYVVHIDRVGRRARAYDRFRQCRRFHPRGAPLYRASWCVSRLLAPSWRTLLSSSRYVAYTMASLGRFPTIVAVGHMVSRVSCGRVGASGLELPSLGLGGLGERT